MKNIKSKNANKIISDIKSKPERIKVNLFLKEDVYNNFKNACDKNDVKVNQVLEALMENFLSDLK